MSNNKNSESEEKLKSRDFECHKKIATNSDTPEEQKS